MTDARRERIREILMDGWGEWSWDVITDKILAVVGEEQPKPAKIDWVGLDCKPAKIEEVKPIDKVEGLEGNLEPTTVPNNWKAIMQLANKLNEVIGKQSELIRRVNDTYR